MTTASVLRGTTFDSRVHAPYIKTAFPAQTTNIGTSVTISAAFYIAGGISPTWTQTGLPAGLLLSSTTGMISGSPSTAGTASFRVTCTNSLGSVQSAAVNWTITANVIAFTLPSLATYFTQGAAATLPLRQYYQAQIPSGHSVTGLALTSGTGPLVAGLSLDGANEQINYDGSSSGTFPRASNIGIDVTTALSGGGSADWTARISAPGVMWYHSFDTDAEMTQFRFTAVPAFGNAYGCDPQGLYPTSALMERIATGGADGGSYLKITRPAGTAESPFWERPFTPFTGATNGRGVGNNDPAGITGGYNVRPNATTITPVAWNPVQGVASGWDYTNNYVNPSYYGNATFSTANPGKFDGSEFYLQVRVKTDPRRTTPANYQAGKKVWTTTMVSSNPAQEIVGEACKTAGGGTYTAGPVGTPNYMDFYVNNGQGSGDMTQVADERSGTSIQLGHDWTGLVCDPYTSTVGGCWAYATDGTWDTLLLHVVPGNTTTKTQIQWYGAHQGETSYKKIWDVHFVCPYDTTPGGGPQYQGWNALYLTTYSNGFTGYPTSEFWEAFDQVIFSKTTDCVPDDMSTLRSNVVSAGIGAAQTGVPTYISSMAAFQVRNLTGTYTPTNGKETVQSVTPAEWQQGDPYSMSIIGPWCGGAKMTNGTKLYLQGGGHGDSANNGLYCFDYAGTAAPTGWTLPKISPVSAVVAGLNVSYSDGLPSASHTNDSICELNGVIYRFGAIPYNPGGNGDHQCWKYTIATNTWVRLGQTPGAISITCCFPDATNNKILVIDRQSSYFSYAFYHPADDTWSAVKNVPQQWGNYPCIAYKPLTATTGIALMSATPVSHSCAVDWTAETLVQTVRTLGAVANANGPCCVYDATADRFWMWSGGGSAPQNLMDEVNPNTWAVTQHTLTGDTIFTELTDGRSYNTSSSRFVYMGAYRAIGFVGNRSRPACVIKLP